MPSYKTHSIHGEMLFLDINKYVDIELEDYKLLCIGPDSLIVTNYKISSFQHANKTKQYFLKLIEIIKEKNLKKNKKVMAFLYGQLTHFILDSVMHPFIYYMTENITPDYKIKPHGLIEMWIDDYIIKKYEKSQKYYYKKCFIKDKQLVKLINQIYKEVYGLKKAVLKYNLGSFIIIMFDTLARTNRLRIFPFLIKRMNLGDFTYNDDTKRIIPYLNLENKIWFNPETGEKYNESFDELWEKSLQVAKETINDVNDYLFEDKELVNKYILNDISWDTGQPCFKGQSLKYTKKYD